MKPHMKQELIDGIVQFWKTIDIAKCRRYINHLVKVIPRVIEVNGEATGYYFFNITFFKLNIYYHSFKYYFRSLLHNCSIASIQFDHTVSNSSVFFQYEGKRSKIALLISYNSFRGSPGSSLPPWAVHFFNRDSPKTASLAILTAKVEALLTLASLWFISITFLIVFLLGQSSIAEDGKALIDIVAWNRE